MKLAALSIPQKLTNPHIKPIKLIREPNSMELKKNFLQNQYQNQKLSSIHFNYQEKDKKTQQKHTKNSFVQTTNNIQCFGFPGLIRNDKKEQNQIKQYLNPMNGKKQIQEDYQKQLKRVTVQMSQHKIIDENADMNNVQNINKIIRNEKLVKIQNILFKNEYVDKKTSFSSEHHKHFQRKNEYQIKNIRKQENLEIRRQAIEQQMHNQRQVYQQLKQQHQNQFEDILCQQLQRDYTKFLQQKKQLRYQ